MADGKIFAAEFALRRNVKALDKILIEDSDDGVVKYAFPPQIAALSGYAYADSIADLPEDPVNKTIGYVVGDKFYIYVGEGGNAKDGLYQEVQGFVGPQGIPGPKGDKGDAGDGAIDEAYLANYLQQNQYQTASDVNSALAIYATQAYVTQEINELLGGASGAYDTLKEIEEILKGNVDSIGDLFDVLDTKWTQDNTLIAHWNEAYSWGNHATAGYVAKTYVDSNFVTLATAQTITGEKNFTGGFKVNGGVLEYNAALGTWVLNGDLLVTGGVSAFSNIVGFTPSTITDAVLIDNGTIKRNSVGALYVASESDDGGIDEAYLAEYLTANNYAKTSDINSALTGYATQSWVTGRGYITASASITGNATTATKLQNAVSLWGRAFDGSADLTGSLNVTTGEGYRIQYNGYDLRFIVSGNSSNRGIWDNTNNEWLMYRPASTDIFFPQGNIAIGSHTAPTERLTVTGNIKALGTLIGADADVSGTLNLTATTSSAFSGAQLLFSGGISRIATSSGGSMYAYAKDFTFRPNSTTSASSIGFTIDANANIAATGNIKASGTLIGADASISNVLNLTATPSQAFDGAQLLFAGGNARIGTTASGFMGLYANTFTFRPSSTSTASTSSFTIDADANLATTGNIFAAGGITMNYSSDRRLKCNIRRFNAREVLMSLGGVWQYEYIDSEVAKNSIYAGSHYGLIYQNVKGSALNKMCYEREDKMGALNYISTDFISIVAGATMENISEIEKLKRENRRLKKRVEQLEKRVA